MVMTASHQEVDAKVFGAEHVVFRPLDVRHPDSPLASHLGAIPWSIRNFMTRIAILQRLVQISERLRKHRSKHLLFGTSPAWRFQLLLRASPTFAVCRLCQHGRLLCAPYPMPSPGLGFQVWPLEAASLASFGACYRQPAFWLHSFCFILPTNLYWRVCSSAVLPTSVPSGTWYRDYPASGNTFRRKES
ncbi:hypothetical protein N658DRAFT_204621 [Parathielavia hyrcaniae]|uniref:Uncharacterized protein n=1 Tax=Parathielavia hyrcaniae TaxID=113614 RepID=A0AAN6PXS5_9PEZI|nr:hypothetical protein N658DRAFT_204621 [Parathielavia hyrcaniae]